MYTFIIKHTKIQGTPMLSTFLLGQPQLTKLAPHLVQLAAGPCLGVKTCLQRDMSL